MNAATEAALALLLAAQQPGKSPYSKIVVETCDETCQKTPLCDEPVLACRPPHWSRRDERFYRYEGWAEGVRRYATIAEAMSRASENMIWVKTDGCAPPHLRKRDDDEPARCKAARKARPWVGSERLLSVVLTTVAFHESDLRRDIHEGRTRGDCDYTTRNGKRVVIEGSCRSSCLGQINLAKDQTTRRGRGRDDLVGLDDAATYRCIEAMVDRLSDARNMCIAQNNGSPDGHYAACTFGIYGGVAGWSKDPRIKKRVATYRRLLKAKKTVDEQVEEALED